MPKATNAFWDGSQHRASPSDGHLVHLFSHVSTSRIMSDIDEGGTRDLWQADAVHRAKNLAQLSLALNSTRLRPVCEQQARNRRRQTRALSGAYDELGSEEDSDGVVPCGVLLEVIARNLVALFGADRTIRLNVRIDHVVLPAEQRRALLLIASELMINALKYAFPVQAHGSIWLNLTQTPLAINLSIIDNGHGILPSTQTGGGGGLMARLALLLTANMYRADNDPGLKVGLSMPRARTIA